MRLKTSTSLSWQHPDGVEDAIDSTSLVVPSGSTSSLGPWSEENAGSTRGLDEEQSPDLPFGATTEKVEPNEDVYAEVDALFRAAKDASFEDGMECDFSRGLVATIRKHSLVSMEAIAHLVIYERVAPEVASEALRWLGHIEHEPTYRYRRWLVERCLLCSSPCVRDAAGLALASMDDPHALPFIRNAVNRESCSELREDLHLVLTQLERSHPWPGSS